MSEMKKPHRKQVKPWNMLRAEERQEYYFMIYEQMGVNRTLKRLWGISRGLGISMSLKTLERYSAVYNWQARILERMARQESQALIDTQAQVEQMNREHVQVFQDMGAVVTASIARWKKEIKANALAGLGPILNVDLPTIAKLAHAYQHGERLARGQATSKAEIMVEVLTPVVKDLMAVFLAVNIISNDPPEMIRQRQAEFVSRGDQVLMTYYGQPRELTEGRGE